MDHSIIIKFLKTDRKTCFKYFVKKEFVTYQTRTILTGLITNIPKIKLKTMKYINGINLFFILKLCSTKTKIYQFFKLYYTRPHYLILGAKNIPWCKERSLKKMYLFYIHYTKVLIKLYNNTTGTLVIFTTKQFNPRW